MNPEKFMRSFIVAFLILFSGWTLSSHICVLLEWDLVKLVKLSFIINMILIYAYFKLSNIKVSPVLVKDLYCVKIKYINEQEFLGMVCVLLLAPALLKWSWVYFWALSTLLLVVCLLPRDLESSFKDLDHGSTNSRYGAPVVLLLAIGAIILAYSTSRSDLDDSFYVAVAAFASANPELAILSVDPMHNERGLPLPFKSYQFSSFELLSGALAYSLSTPAMDVYYIYLLPLWAIAAVFSIFLLTQQMVPKHWLLTGVFAIFFIFLLGEMHRSPANFSVLRIFQGKAVFLSVIVPSIFYLTYKYFSKRGCTADLILLGCCQIAAIGLSNYGMLGAPIAFMSALASNAPYVLKSNVKKLYGALAICLIPLPYLLAVAMEAYGSPIMSFPAQTAESVWGSVFGKHQQYLVAILLLAGPVLAKDAVTRWRLAIPALIMFLIYLNPWLSAILSNYVTTPAVYWRLTWSFPVIPFVAISFSVVIFDLVEKQKIRFHIAMIIIVIIGLIFVSIPFNTFRSSNSVSISQFAEWKVPETHLRVAQNALTYDTGRLLAPDEIAGVVSRFESHPPLVTTRGLYLNLLRSSYGEVGYQYRVALHRFVTGTSKLPNRKLVKDALIVLDVSTVVVNQLKESSFLIQVLKSSGYKHQEVIFGYSFWSRLPINQSL